VGDFNHRNHPLHVIDLELYCGLERPLEAIAFAMSDPTYPQGASRVKVGHDRLPAWLFGRETIAVE
jgi:hypothetical protein